MPATAPTGGNEPIVTPLMVEVNASLETAAVMIHEMYKKYGTNDIQDERDDLVFEILDILITKVGEISAKHMWLPKIREAQMISIERSWSNLTDNPKK